jgi:crossover junction endodeoxyribonuclease RuvC
MLILGIDPGTATTGFGLVNLNGKGNEVVTWGLIETDKKLLKETRLDFIFEETVRLIKTHKPDVFVFEKIFFATNAKTVIAVGQAQGVMLLAASKTKVRVEEYAPGTIKKMITGNGRANKKEVQMHIKKILGKRVTSDKRIKKTHFDNAADALAIALTHAFKLGEDKSTIKTQNSKMEVKVKNLDQGSNQSVRNK